MFFRSFLFLRVKLEGGICPMLRMKREFFQLLLDHARQLWPYESCGVLLGQLREGQKVISRVIKATNVVAGKRKDWFNIEPKELKEIFDQAAREGEEVLGFYHSHPGGKPVPSASDQEQLPWPFYSFLIIALDQEGEGEIKSWNFNEEKGSFEEEEIIWE